MTKCPLDKASIISNPAQANTSNRTCRWGSKYTSKCSSRRIRWVKWTTIWQVSSLRRCSRGTGAWIMVGTLPITLCRIINCKIHKACFRISSLQICHRITRRRKSRTPKNRGRLLISLVLLLQVLGQRRWGVVCTKCEFKRVRMTRKQKKRTSWDRRRNS